MSSAANVTRQKKQKGLAWFNCLGKNRPPPATSDAKDSVRGNDDDANHDGNDNNLYEPMDNSTPAAEVNGHHQDDSGEKPVQNDRPASASASSPGLSPEPDSSLLSGGSPLPPKRGGFLVSFMVDARGGAMTGSRGSGLRMMIPPGATYQPIRVTCRYLKSSKQDRLLQYPPPLMERDALASRIIESGPAGVKFHLPILLEVPHFASLREGERELIVLRSDDGQTWQEHTMMSLRSWNDSGSNEGEIYQDMVAATGISTAFEVLSTDRIVRISTQTLPRYFAILSRVREEIRTIGAEGGTIPSDEFPNLHVHVPKNALQKKIKVALQVQSIPPALVPVVCPGEIGRQLKVAPLIALDPRRRRFHRPIHITVPLPPKDSNKAYRKVYLLFSLTNSSSRANWEDVTEETNVSLQKHGCEVKFETNLSALFWVMAVDRETKTSVKVEERAKADEGGKAVGSGGDSRQLEATAVVQSANKLYNELLLPPYMARIVVIHRPHSPHPWCDSLRVYCVTDDKAELVFDHKYMIGSGSPFNTLRSLKSLKSATVGGEEWSILGESEEVEVTAGSSLTIDVDGTNIAFAAADCQLETDHVKTLSFSPFRNNSCSLLVKAKNSSKPMKGRLVVKKSLSLEPSSALFTIDLPAWEADYDIPEPFTTSWTLNARREEPHNKAENEMPTSMVAHSINSMSNGNQ